MASEENRKPVVVVDGNDLIVELSKTQLAKIFSGCTSDDQINPHASHLAQTHAYCKEEGLTGPDSFCRFIYVYDGAGDPTETHVEALKGATKSLCIKEIRVLDLKQTVKHQSGEWETYPMTAVYDKQNICFVNLSGKMVYVKRSQLFTKHLGRGAKCRPGDKDQEDPDFRPPQLRRQDAFYA